MAQKMEMKWHMYTETVSIFQNIFSENPYGLILIVNFHSFDGELQRDRPPSLAVLRTTHRKSTWSVQPSSLFNCRLCCPLQTADTHPESLQLYVQLLNLLVQAAVIHRKGANILCVGEEFEHNKIIILWTSLWIYSSVLWHTSNIW